MAAVLSDQGVAKGDRVIIYMPMIPEAAMAMLACARLGAVHSVVFGGFAATSLATRIDDAKPKAIIAASCGIEPGRCCLQAAARRGHRAVRAQAGLIASCCSASSRRLC
jgi:acyl-coenzyme A synthetase/AMP-(fatty) acid ligase